MTLFPKERTFLSVGEKALSCWGFLRVGCLEWHALKWLFLTKPGREILDLKTDTLVCKECWNGLEKIDY